MTFEERLEQIISILKDSNVTFEGKEIAYETFINEYPYFDTSKLDNIAW